MGKRKKISNLKLIIGVMLLVMIGSLSFGSFASFAEGDTLSEAEEISFGKNVTGSTYGVPFKDHYSYYKLELPANMIVHIDLKGLDDSKNNDDYAKLRIASFDAEGNLIDSCIVEDENNWGYVSGGLTTSMKKGTNFIGIAVKNFWTGTINYEFKVKEERRASDKTCIRGYGSGYLKDAYGLTIGQTIYDKFKTNDHVHNFKFVLDKKKTIKLNVAHLNGGDTGTCVKISDSRGNEIVSFDPVYYDEFTEGKTYTYNLKAGSYFLTVTEEKDYINAYYRIKTSCYVTGWIKTEKGIKYVYEDGKYATKGWKTISGHQYYFKADGCRYTGWLKLGKKKYYLNPKTGVRAVGWKTIGKNRYYFDQFGVMLTGWLRGSSGCYHFTSKGVMQTGWQTIKGKKYYFSAKGKMQTGWKKIGKYKYFFSKKGIMQTGWKKLKGHMYYFDKGRMVTGKKKIGKKVYRFKKNGVCINP